jgi:hypothetical protein
MCVRAVLRAARISKAMLHPNVFSFRVMFDKWLASTSAGVTRRLTALYMPQLIFYLYSSTRGLLNNTSPINETLQDFQQDGEIFT